MGASPEVIGRYAIHGKIASGGMASVHFGRLRGGEGFSRTVAIKRLHPHLAEDPEFRVTLVDEARMAARIHHPNVVPTLDVVSLDGELLLVMEYVRGESLARLLRAETEREGRVPLAIASAIAVGTLHGLHAAHEATSDRGAPLGIVHRDVSPQNILVGIDGVARVIDFGVAKATGRLQTTGEGVVKGKIAYMAPEQLSSAQATRAADVYAMGVVLWEMFAGRRLFQAETNPAIVALVLAGAKIPPSAHAQNLPQGLDAVVMRALALNPADRFATALDMAERLMRVVAPAFPTRVGDWCERTARDSIAKRGMLVAEIESQSDIAPASLALPPKGTPSRSEAPATVREPPDVLSPDDVPVQVDVDRASHALPLRNQGVADDAPTIASQSASLSIEAPKPSVRPRKPSQRVVVTGALGAGVLVLGVVALVWGRSTPTGPPTAATTVTVTDPAPPPVAQAGVAPVSPPPTGVPQVSPSEAVTPPAPATSGPSLPPRPGVAPRAASGATQPAAAPASRAKVNCNPPYEFDSQGKKTWKRQCL